MIDSGTEIKTSDGEITISELLTFLRKSKEFEKIYGTLELVEAVAYAAAKSIKTFDDGRVDAKDPRLSDSREPLEHKHSPEDLEDVYSKDEIEVLFSETIKNLKKEISLLPEQSRKELEKEIKSAKKDLESKINSIQRSETTVINQVETTRLVQLEKQQKDLVSLVENVIDKAEGELKEVQEKLLLEMSQRINEGGKKVNIIGGINIGQKLKLLKDVSVENVTDGQALVWSAALQKWVPGAGGGGGTPGGSDTQVQFNDAGSFGGDSTFTFNKTTNVLNVSQIIASGQISTSTSITLEETGAGTDIIAIQAPSSIAAGYTLTLPVDDGAADQALKTDGSGVLSWFFPNGAADSWTTITTSGTINAMPITTNKIRYNNGSATTINGIANDGTARAIYLQSVGVGITLTHQNASASANDRIILPNGQSKLLQANTGEILLWDTVTQRWRLADFPSPIGTSNAAPTRNIFTTDSGTVGGTSNLVMGTEAVSAGTFAGAQSILIGYRAGQNINGSPGNITIVGANSALVVTGNNNTVIGSANATKLSTGTANFIGGVGAATSLTTGSSNIAIGSGPALALTTGSTNINIGSGAGTNNTTGSNNIWLGTSTGADAGQTNLTNAIAIGFGARNTASDQCLIGGVGNPVNTGFNIANPAYRVDIGGDCNVTGNYYINGVLFSLANAWNIAGNTGSGLLLGTTDDNDWDLIANNVGIGKIKSSGLVGFQESSPDAVVHIGLKTGGVGDPTSLSASINLVTSGGYGFSSGNKDYAEYAIGSVSGVTVYSATGATTTFNEPASGDFAPTAGSATSENGVGYDPTIDTPPTYEIWAVYGATFQSSTTTASTGSWSDPLNPQQVLVSWAVPTGASPDYYFIVRNATDYQTTGSSSLLDQNSSWTAGTDPGLNPITNYTVNLNGSGVSGATGYRFLNTTSGTFLDDAGVSVSDDGGWASGSTVTPTTEDYNSLEVDGRTVFNAPARLKGYTVATLPSNAIEGDIAYVTDATLPTFLGVLTGGGAVRTPVFYNGSAWVSY